MPEERQSFLNAGADEVCPKPLDFGKLMQVIQRLLPTPEQRRADIEAAAAGQPVLELKPHPLE